MDRLTEMEAFLRVVELGGFTEAARRMGLSKSAVSKHVAALENRLGARLINRTTRRVSPTEIGLAYYDRVARVIAEAAEADAMVGAMQSTPRGELRVSAPVSFGIRRLGPIVADFLLVHPEVSVHLVLDDRFVELAAEGFDVAVRIGRLPDSSLRARRLSETRMLLVAAPAYLDRAGRPRTLDDLARHQLLHYSHLSTGNVWRLPAPGGQEREIRVGGRLTVNNGDALLAAARRGLGIAMVPCFFLENGAGAGLEHVLPEIRPEPVGIWAVYPPGRFVPPKLRAFIDFIAAALRPGGQGASEPPPQGMEPQHHQARANHDGGRVRREAQG
ncbi:MAG: LysR family transcriptional regulator [Paracoccaceae bacterium]|nr:MAG: LysR family transcriptional regulator [Paracoccaceae bacterium]